MKENPPRKLALEYIVGSSALPKSLNEGFEKIFGIKRSSSGNDRNISRYRFRLQPMHANLSENEKN
jgi:fatty-acyl-CoA synthase